MAQYQTGIATSRTDLMSKLYTFAGSNGWTQDDYNGSILRMSLHQNNCYVHFLWDDPNTLHAKSIAMYQSLGFTGGNNSWDHPDDAGGQDITTHVNLDYQRKSVKYIGDGPFTAYHFFAYTDIPCIHCVLEVSAGIYRHFGFGTIDKFGTWTGGEWVAGHCLHYDAEGSVVSTANSVLLDGIHDAYLYEEGFSGATIHMEGFPEQDSGTESTKWGHVGANTLFSRTGDDRAGKNRMCVMGGMRRSWWLQSLAWKRSDPVSGLIPLIPIPIFYRQIGVTPDAFRLMGFMHNVYHLQMGAYDPGDVFSIGGSDYVVFPMVRKRHEGGAGAESWNCGIVYRKIV